MLKVLTLLFLLSSTFQAGNSQILSFIKDVYDMVQFFNFIMETKGNIQEVFNSMTGDNSKDSEMILSNLNMIERKLDYMNNFITNKLQEVHNEIRRLPLKQQIQHLEDKLSLHIQTVEIAYLEIKEVLQQPTTASETHLQTLVSNHYIKVSDSVEEIQKSIAPYEDRNKAEGLAEWYQQLTTENMLHRCGSGASPQQLLLGLYVDITKTETKAMAVLMFLTSLQRLEEHAWKTLLRRYIRRYNAYAESFRSAFNNTSRDHRSCDPTGEGSWSKDLTFAHFDEYDQITAFHRRMAGSIGHPWPGCSKWIPKVYQNVYRSPSACTNFLHANRETDSCWMSEAEKCYGELTDCFVATLTRCLSGGSTYRRYLWLQDVASSKNYGDTGRSCSGEYLKLLRDTAVHESDSCVCRCMRPNHHAISLKLSLSDITKNRVITGMRLAMIQKPWKVQYITYIQIKQGTLKPDGRIVDESDTWEPSQPFRNLYNQFILTTKGHGIHLDNLVGMDDEVLTGIGFMRSKEAPELRVKLQIQVTKFNYTTGQLGNHNFQRVISASDQWSTQYKPGGGNPLMHMQENVPRFSPRNETSKYVVIEASSLADDAGQTALPLLDLVPVEGRPPSPLGGAELFHKSVPNYGGFISLRAIGINIAKYFNDGVKVMPSTLFTSANKTIREMIADAVLEGSLRNI